MMDTAQQKRTDFLFDTLQKLQNITIAVEQLKSSLLQEVSVQNPNQTHNQRQRPTDGQRTERIERRPNQEIENNPTQSEPMQKSDRFRQSYSRLTLHDTRFSAPQYPAFRRPIQDPNYLTKRVPRRVPEPEPLKRDRDHS